MALAQGRPVELLLTCEDAQMNFVLLVAMRINRFVHSLRGEMP